MARSIPISSVFLASTLSIDEVMLTQADSISAAPSTAQIMMRFRIFCARAQPES